MNLDNLIKSINFKDEEYIVVGVSSGPDSMALLHLLLHNTNNKIVCAHINHNVRKNSIIEENYLKEYCQKNHIIFECHKILSYKENNFENEARTIRYNFYEKILKKYHSHSLFLAHHGDDLVETIIMKIIRGSNLEGYAGIKKYSKLKDYTIIRPLLDITKEDIIKYNKENNIKYYIDNSNEDTTYTRNRIRKNILPVLKKEDKNIHLKFLNYSNTIQEYYNYIERITHNKIKQDYKNNIIDIEKFRKEDPFLQKNIVFYLLASIYDNRSNIIKEKNIDDIINLTKNKNPNLIIDLPKDYIAKKEYKYIYIGKENKQKNKEKYKIEFHDKIEINDLIIEKIKSTNSNGNNVCKLNSKNIKLPLFFRNKENGDYIEVLGLNGKKKISEIFIENKIPKDERNNYPILIDADGKILWIPNIKKSKYNVKNNELYDIILTSYKKGGNNVEEKNK